MVLLSSMSIGIHRIVLVLLRIKSHWSILVLLVCRRSLLKWRRFCVGKPLLNSELVWRPRICCLCYGTEDVLNSVPSPRRVASYSVVDLSVLGFVDLDILLLQSLEVLPEVLQSIEVLAQPIY